MKIDPAAVAFDIDGVVADTMRLFLRIAREEYDLNELRYQQLTHYMLEECLDIDPAIIGDIIRKLLDGSRDRYLRPIDGAVDTLNRIGNGHGFVRFVTARPDAGPIREWMQKTLSLPEERIDIVATGSFDAKVDVLKEKEISVFVEDRLETCILLDAAGITPVLFRQPWNRQPHPFTEVAGWETLGEMLSMP